MDRAPQRRTLVVANRTASTPLLLEEIERRAAERPTAFVLLIPDVSSRKAADWTLTEALVAMRRAARGVTGRRTTEVEGRLGGEDALASIQEALAEQDFDDVIISTLPKRTSQWLRRDLPRRVEKLGVPVTVVTQPGEERIGLKDLPMSGPG